MHTQTASVPSVMRFQVFPIFSKKKRLLDNLCKEDEWNAICHISIRTRRRFAFAFMIGRKE